jgi:Ser/Thr protein kinase RdoA (MazF antagonist)
VSIFEDLDRRLAITPPLHLLSQYALTNVKAALHAHTHHRVYLIESDQGTYVLRVQHVSTRPRLEQEGGHLAILAARGLPVPSIVLTAQGDSTAVDGEEVGLLMRLLSGERPTLETVDEALMARAGQLLAAVHGHSASDSPLSEGDALFGERGFYPLAALRLRLTALQQEALRRVWSVLEDTLAQVGRCLLHGDFVLHNLLVDGESLALVDFEYSRFGDARYDLGSLLWQIRVVPNWPALQAAFLRSYQDAGGIIQGELEPWLAVRQLASLHWVAHNRSLVPRAEQVIEQRLRELVDFTVGGHLQRA